MRRRPWLQRFSLLALVALVALLGTTACNARYDYYHHGPPINPATPAGTYTVDVIAQSSNGVTATTHFTTMALTIK
jgi:ABC-type oligopeptide transport system substrate-binding subunit